MHVIKISCQLYKVSHNLNLQLTVPYLKPNIKQLQVFFPIHDLFSGKDVPSLLFKEERLVIHAGKRQSTSLICKCKFLILFKCIDKKKLSSPMFFRTEKYLQCRQDFTMPSKWLHQVCGNVTLTNIVNTVDATSIVCDDVWQMQCHGR